MKKLIITGFFCLFSILAKAAIQAEVEPSQVSMGESFKLILTQNNLQNRGVPDLTPLQKDFIILGTEQHINYSVINGQSQSGGEWIVSLKPQRSGKLTIPTIKIGMEQTTPINIDVTKGQSLKNAPTNTTRSHDVVLTAQVNVKKPYVNQQVIYKVTLYNSKQLLDVNYQGPQVENGLLIPLGEEKRYQIRKNNINYIVEEQNYAVYPQKSGSLKITSPIFNALVYDWDPQRISAQDKTINLMVQPIPKQYTGKIWLPAKKVQLTEQYENEGQTIAQGSTLIRTVTLEGIGIPAQLLPSLNFAQTDAFNVYPEKGKDNNQVTQGELVSNTEIKVTYLFNKAGKITIPELKLPWFNTKTGKEEFAILPPKTLEVTPSAVALTTATPQQAIPTAEVNTPSTQETNKHTSIQDRWPWMLTLLFALAWLITLALWSGQRRAGNSQKRHYKNALQELHKACMQSQPMQARDALLKWANLHWPDAHLLNLTELSYLAEDVQLKKQIHILSQALYKNEETFLWRGDELWRCIQVVKQKKSGKKRKVRALPPINPF